MHQHVVSGSSATTSTEEAVIAIWCQDREGRGQRVYALLNASLTRAKVILLDGEYTSPWDESEPIFLLISDHMHVVLDFENWLQKRPQQTASLLYIEPEREASKVSLDNLHRYNGIQRLEKKDLHLADIMVKGLLYPLMVEYLQGMESAQKQMDVLIDHIKGQLSVFYHNINNPLTVLSGNLQLLHILAESIFPSE